ncbi:MAG: terpene cyclase/mutase family protein [Planctomycetota bacterium]|jgi:hypothetical protein|nr:terpene cyclase/mutase family protein [Planctomycetota bacterium]
MSLIVIALLQITSSSPAHNAAAKGLVILANSQQEDGSWAADVGYKLDSNYKVWQQDVSHVGVTALAGMAFLAGGHVPERGKYGAVVEKTVRYISKQIKQDGYISANETRMYSHAFATLFLAEVYGMTQSDEVRGVLQRAVNLIVASQNENGGWRYQPHVADSDMSVAACQVLALRAAHNIGIQVPVSTIDAAVSYVRKSAIRNDDPAWSFYRDSRPGDFRYQPNLRARASFALTAAGITILHGAGVYADADIERGLQRLESQLSSFSREFGSGMGGHYYFYYGHYYAMQAFHIAGGERYQNYMRLIQSELLSMQNADGSWPNTVGPGTTYGTATACLILLSSKEYLPIFQR